MSEVAGLKGQRIAAPGPGSRSSSAGDTQHCQGAGPGTGGDHLWLEQPAVVLVIVLPNNSSCGHGPYRPFPTAGFNVHSQF